MPTATKETQDPDADLAEWIEEQERSEMAAAVRGYSAAAHKENPNLEAERSPQAVAAIPKPTPNPNYQPPLQSIDDELSDWIGQQDEAGIKAAGGDRNKYYQGEVQKLHDAYADQEMREYAYERSKWFNERQLDVGNVSAITGQKSSAWLPPADEERPYLDKRLGRKATDAEWKRFQKMAPAYIHGRRAVIDAGVNATDIAATVPDDLRDMTAEAAADIFRREKPAEKAGPTGRTEISMEQGWGRLNKILEPLRGYGAKTRAAGAKISQAAGAGAYAGSAMDLGNIPKHLLQMAPMLAGTVAVPQASSAIWGADTGEGLQENLINQGVDPAIAKAAGFGAGAFAGYIFRHLSPQLTGELNASQVSKLAGFAENFGQTATQTLENVGVEATLAKAAKFASGVTGSDKAGQEYAEAFRSWIEGLPVLAVAHSAQLIGKKPPEPTLEQRVSPYRQELDARIMSEPFDEQGKPKPASVDLLAQSDLPALEKFLNAPSRENAKKAGLSIPKDSNKGPQRAELARQVKEAKARAKPPEPPAEAEQMTEPPTVPEQPGPPPGRRYWQDMTPEERAEIDAHNQQGPSQEISVGGHKYVPRDTGGEPQDPATFKAGDQVVMLDDGSRGEILGVTRPLTKKQPWGIRVRTDRGEEIVEPKRIYNHSQGDRDAQAQAEPQPGQPDGGQGGPEQAGQRGQVPEPAQQAQEGQAGGAQEQAQEGQNVGPAQQAQPGQGTQPAQQVVGQHPNSAPPARVVPPAVPPAQSPESPSADAPPNAAGTEPSPQPPQPGGTAPGAGTPGVVHTPQTYNVGQSVHYTASPGRGAPRNFVGEIIDRVGTFGYRIRSGGEVHLVPADSITGIHRTAEQMAQDAISGRLPGAGGERGEITPEEEEMFGLNQPPPPPPRAEDAIDLAMPEVPPPPPLGPTYGSVMPAFIHIPDNLVQIFNNAIKQIRDIFGNSHLPNLARVGRAVHDAAFIHATSATAMRPVVRDMLRKVLGAKVNNQALRTKLAETLNADNLLGVYDGFVSAGDQAKADALNAANPVAALDQLVRRNLADPEIATAINRWKQHVNPQLESLWQTVRRLDPNDPVVTRGRHTDARVNLLTTDAAEKWAKFRADDSSTMPEGSGSASYRNPDVKRDPFARRAHGTSEYSTDLDLMLSAVYGPRFREATKLRFYDALVDSGSAIYQSYGDKTFNTPIPEGWQRLPIDLHTGGNPRMERGVMWIKPELVKEARRVIGTDQAPDPSWWAQALTAVQVASGMDAFTHAVNVVNAIHNSLGAFESSAGDLARKVPLLGSLDTMARLWHTSARYLAGDAKLVERAAELAKIGALRPEFKHGGAAGAFLRNLDTAGRLVLDKFYDNLVKRGAEDTIAGRRDFINQLGVYHGKVMGEWERIMRARGLSPFIVAGRTMNRLGMRVIAGDPGFRAASAKVSAQARMIQLSKLPLTAMTAAVANYLLWGNASGAPGVRFGAVYLGKDKDQKDRQLDLLQFEALGRGLRLFGARKGIEDIRQGKDPNQTLGDMKQEIISSWMHPWIGPGVSGLAKGIFGVQLDNRGNFQPDKIEGGGIAQEQENFRSMLESQNPLFYYMGRAAYKMFGGKTDSDTDWHQDLNTALTRQAGSTIGYTTVGQSSDAAEEMAWRLFRDKLGPQETAEEKRLSAVKRELMGEIKADSPQGIRKLNEAVNSQQITMRQATNIVKHAQMGNLAWYANGLTIPQIKLVWDKADADEKQVIASYVLGHRKAGSQRDADIMSGMADDYQKIMKEKSSGKRKEIADQAQAGQ